MQSVLIVIHLLVVIALVAVVLLQRSEGGALGAGGGGGFMTGRGQANALSRATAILGTLFFVTALAMSMLAGAAGLGALWLEAGAPSPMIERGARFQPARIDISSAEAKNSVPRTAVARDNALAWPRPVMKPPPPPAPSAPPSERCSSTTPTRAITTRR